MALPLRFVEKDFYTEDEYLSWEEDALTKSEYIDGEIRAMSGGSLDHAAIPMNIAAELRAALRERGCRVLSSDMKIRAAGAIYYADLTVVCGPCRFHGRGRSVVANPSLVVEVLSPSTENKDRGEKFLRYQQIEALMSYMLVSQEAPRVELFTRMEDGHWNYSLVTGLESVLDIPAFSISLKMAEIYDQIDFTDQGLDE